jgi:hypothetical protein
VNDGGPNIIHLRGWCVFFERWMIGSVENAIAVPINIRKHGAAPDNNLSFERFVRLI